MKLAVRYQPNRDNVSNDDIQTPPALAQQLVAHFAPPAASSSPVPATATFSIACHRAPPGAT